MNKKRKEKMAKSKNHTTSKSPQAEPDQRRGKLHRDSASSSSSQTHAVIRFEKSDYLLLAIFTACAVFTRLYRIALPPAVVFDELHFSKFVDRMLTSTWFFDIHPPLGKLILAYGGYMLGYRPDPDFVIEKIGNVYPDHMKYVLVRYVSATFSIFTVPLTYLISRAMRMSAAGASFATATVLLDFLGVIEGRLILMDSQLLFFCQSALLSALVLWQTQPRSRSRLAWVVITGLLAGAAFSIKHTALGTPGLIAIISFFGLHFLDIPLTVSECSLAAVSGLSIYVASFYIMFNSLWSTGGKYDNFMPLHFRKTLKGGQHFDPLAKRVSFVRLFLYLNKRMVEANANIKKRHTWESDWYHWIANWRGVLYYLKKFQEGEVPWRSQIYLIGNPVVIYLVLACVLLFMFTLAVSVRYRNAFSKRRFHKELEWARGTGVFLLSGWLCNLLPYILVDRAAFIYHYLPGLFYGQLLCGVLVDALPSRLRTFCCVMLIAVMGAAFVYWSPWIYAIPLPADEQFKRRWLPRWT